MLGEKRRRQIGKEKEIRCSSNAKEGTIKYAFASLNVILMIKRSLYLYTSQNLIGNVRCLVEFVQIFLRIILNRKSRCKIGNEREIKNKGRLYTQFTSLKCNSVHNKVFLSF